MATKGVKFLKKEGDTYTVEIDIKLARIIEINKELAADDSSYSFKYVIDNVGDLTKEKRFLLISEKNKKGVDPVRYEIANVKKPLGEG